MGGNRGEGWELYGGSGGVEATARGSLAGRGPYCLNDVQR